MGMEFMNSWTAPQCLHLPLEVGPLGLSMRQKCAHSPFFPAAPDEDCRFAMLHPALMPLPASPVPGPAGQTQ